MAMLGMDMSEMQRGPGRRGQQTQTQSPPADAEPTAERKQEAPDPVNILRGIFGR
jgi:hypothetical protein